jgi:hypothetical protein
MTDLTRNLFETNPKKTLFKSLRRQRLPLLNLRRKLDTKRLCLIMLVGVHSNSEYILLSMSDT